MALKRSSDWPLLIGAQVEIRRSNATIRIGTVDDAMPDSSALWIAADDLQLRSLYEASAGYEVWAEPQEHDGPNRYRFTAARIFPAHSKAS